MNVLIMTSGSRGDIQPYLALAVGLQARGHQVMLAAPGNFESLVRPYNVPFTPVDSRILELESARGATEGKANVLKLMQQVKPIMRQMFDDYWTAAQRAQPDRVVFHPKTLVGYSIAEKLGVPPVIGLPLPLSTPTAAFPAPIFPRTSFGGAYNRFTYRLIGLLTASYAGLVNDWRKTVLGLPKRSGFASDLIAPDGSPTLTLYAYSECVIPKPVDWDAHTHVTGYWTLPPAADWQPPQELLNFLVGETPPIYIGFGSMGGATGEARARSVLEALRVTGQRAILATGWGGLQVAENNPNVLVIDQAPHEWLFERVSAVVHHGGAGTTGAALRAGKPNVIIPFFGDQPFWADRVQQLGVGTAPIPHKRLNAQALAAALTQVRDDQAMQARAADLGAALRAENGVERAVQILTGSSGLTRN